MHVEDHAKALWTVATQGLSGETYNIGGLNEKTNLEVVRAICTAMDQLLPESQYKPHADLITYVDDRPGHDQRYAIDVTHIEEELGWVPDETFESGLRNTVEWYLKNSDWWQAIFDGSYQLSAWG